MPFLELTLRCREADQPRYEHALEDVGALAVTLLDAEADTSNEHAILEPGVGETPLWDDVQLSALFADDADALVLLAALEAFDPALDWAQVRFRTVADQDWERAWMDQYVPLRFGARTWIVPWNQPLPDEADTDDAAVVRLDPGLAFGSGILALAALKLGAAAAVGIDNDPQALLATHDNAERNGIDAQLAVYRPEDAPDARYPVVVANILAVALDALAEQLAARVTPGGRLALSGILAGQEPALLERYAPWFDSLQVTREGDWVRIDGIRIDGSRR